MFLLIIIKRDKLGNSAWHSNSGFFPVLYGDINGDGKITAVDYVAIKNYIMKRTNLDSVYKEAADVDKSGGITAVDYVRVKNNIMGNYNISQ